jgi:5'-nucleotidase
MLCRNWIILVVAPDKPQSAGHAITINSTLYLNKISKKDDPFTEYSCSGTPVDCVNCGERNFKKTRSLFLE